MRVTSNVTIEAPFFGFPDVGHGGYTAGIMAERLAGSLEVRFLSPPPLEVPLTLTEHDEALALADGNTLIAEAKCAELDVVVPTPPSFEQAEASMAAYLNLPGRPSPTCMTCGTERAFGEGLRVFIGPVEGTGLAAGVWTPHRNFADEAANVRTRFVWAALDCPTFWGIRWANEDIGRVVTAKLAARVIAPIPADSPSIVVGWPIAHKKRLFRGGAAVFSASGDLLAVAEATWMRSD
jgi:hypothetical protein